MSAVAICIEQDEEQTRQAFFKKAKHLTNFPKLCNPNAPQYDCKMKEKLVSEKPYSFHCPNCKHQLCYALQTSEEIDRANQKAKDDFNAQLAEFKRDNAKKPRPYKSISQQVVCMCVETNCFLGTKTSTCRRCNESLVEFPIEVDQDDPNNFVCRCEVRHTTALEWSIRKY